MSMPLPTVAAAPAEITLGGQPYRLAPLTHGDLAELERWMQQQVVALAKHAAEGLGKTDRQKVLSDAVFRASTLTIASEEGSAMMTSMAGMTRMLWLGMRRENPGLTEQALADLLSAPGAMEEVMQAFDQINATAGGDVGKSGGAGGVASPTTPPSTGP